MDTEDRDHFKTLQNPSARKLDVWRQQQKRVSSQSDPDLAYYLKAAQLVCGSYRRDEAHNPEAFASALGTVLSDYSRQVVDFVADPRTGVSTEYPNGLPNVGQIRDFCDVIVRRMDVLSKPKPVAAPFVPPPVKPGQIDYVGFQKLAAEGKTKSRPVGRFEKVDDEWNRNARFGIVERNESQGFIDANKKWFNKECAGAGKDPSFETISPSLDKMLDEQENKGGGL